MVLQNIKTLIYNPKTFHSFIHYNKRNHSSLLIISFSFWFRSTFCQYQFIQPVWYHRDQICLTSQEKQNKADESTSHYFNRTSKKLNFYPKHNEKKTLFLYWIAKIRCNQYNTKYIISFLSLLFGRIFVPKKRTLFYCLLLVVGSCFLVHFRFL